MRRLLMLLVALAGLAHATTVTLNGLQYTLKAHPRVWFDGPGGVADASNKYNAGLPAKATEGNPAWQAVKNWQNSLLVAYPYNSPANWRLYFDGSAAATLAAAWYSDNTQTAAHDAALYLLNNIEKYYQFPCDDVNGKNCNFGYSPSSYGMVFYAADWTLAYELMRGEMTTQQRQNFAAKVLNDEPEFGGINGSPTTACTNPTTINGGTITTNSTGQATATAPLFGPGHALQVGDWIIGGPGITQIASITDSTHAALAIGNLGTWSNYSGAISYRPATWTDGNCGIIWLSKHEVYSPPVLSLVAGTSLYPRGNPNWGGWGPGGTTVEGWASNNTFAHAPGMMAYFLSLVEDDPNATVRSQYQITLLYNDWYANDWQAILTTSWTGFHHSGSAYGLDRPRGAANMHVMIENSLVSPPALGGIWDRNQLYQMIYTLPSAYGQSIIWGQDNLGGGRWDAQHTAYHMPLYFLYRNSNEGKWFHWMLANRIVKNSFTAFSVAASGANLLWQNVGYGSVGNAQGWSPWLYLFEDPAFPSVDMGGANVPNAVVLNQVDSTIGPTPQSIMLSRTGVNSITDTLTVLNGFFDAYWDHNITHTVAGSPQMRPGDYRIFKGNYLLAADNSSARLALNQINGPRFEGGGNASMYMEIGGAFNLIGAGNPTKAVMPRGVVDGQNRLAYAMVDSTQSYVPAVGVTRNYRHLIDLKGGSQQYIVVYDDVATSSGQMKRTYLHYPNTAVAADATRGTTSVSGATITSSYPGTGHSDATQLISTVLAPAGSNTVRTYTDNVDGTYSGGSGGTFRVSLCASTDGATCDSGNTAAEFLVVHKPVTGTGNTMPTLTQPSVSALGGTATAVQIADASAPKVAIFARQGSSLTAVRLTTTHAGTAQYAAVGMAAGTYNLTGPVFTILTVGADGVAYWEGAAGDYILTQGYTPPGTPPTITTATLSPGTVGSAYSQALAAAGDTPITWSVTAGSLPSGLALDTSTGAISGTPSGAGTASFTIQASNGSGSDTKPLSITIVLPPATGTGPTVRGTTRGAIIK